MDTFTQPQTSYFSTPLADTNNDTPSQNKAKQSKPKPFWATPLGKLFSRLQHISSQQQRTREREKIHFINANHQACNNITFSVPVEISKTHIYRITFVFHLSRGLRTQTHKPSVEFHLVPAAESLTLSLEGEFSGSNADASQCTKD